MALASPIAWTDTTWNPVTGCDKVSPGCTHCYAERMATRLAAMGQANYARGFELTLQPAMLELPLRWRKSRRIFVNSMSDLFHDEVPLDYVRRVFDVMQRASWHEFQVLTKRAERLAQVASLLPWPRNIWMGVSVESEKFVARIEALRTVPAAVRFLSLEPLLGPLPALDWRGIDWAIVGGESGPGARPLDPAWVRDLREQCAAARVPFFFKQWGGVRKKATGRVLDGRTWDELPTPQVDRSPRDGCMPAGVESRLPPLHSHVPPSRPPRSSKDAAPMPSSPIPSSFDDFEQEQRSFDLIDQHRAALAAEAVRIAREAPDAAVAGLAGLIVTAEAPEAEALLAAIGLPEEAARSGFLGIVPRELAAAILRDVAMEALDELVRLEAKVAAGARPLAIVLLAKEGLRLGLASYEAEPTAGG